MHNRDYTITLNFIVSEKFCTGRTADPNFIIFGKKLYIVVPLKDNRKISLFDPYDPTFWSTKFRETLNWPLRFVICCEKYMETRFELKQTISRDSNGF